MIPGGAVNKNVRSGVPAKITRRKFEENVKYNNNKVVSSSVVIESQFFESSQSRVMEVRVRASTSFDLWKNFEFE